MRVYNISPVRVGTQNVNVSMRGNDSPLDDTQDLSERIKKVEEIEINGTKIVTAEVDGETKSVCWLSKDAPKEKESLLKKLGSLFLKNR